MTNTHLRIRFANQEFILVGGDLARGGAITTPEDYAAFQPSFAHLFEDGTIMRYHQQIGTREDIEVLGECEVLPTKEGVVRGLTEGMKVLDALAEGQPWPKWERRA